MSTTSVSYGTSGGGGPTSGQTASQVNAAISTAVAPIAQTQTTQGTSLAALAAKDVVLEGRDTTLDAKITALESKDIAHEAKDVLLTNKQVASSTLHPVTAVLSLVRNDTTTVDQDLSSLKGTLHAADVTAALATPGVYALTVDAVGDIELTPAATGSGSVTTVADPAALATLVASNTLKTSDEVIQLAPAVHFIYDGANLVPRPQNNVVTVADPAVLATLVASNTLNTSDEVIQLVPAVHFIYDGTNLIPRPQSKELFLPTPSPTGITQISPVDMSANKVGYWTEVDGTTFEFNDPLPVNSEITLTKTVAAGRLEMTINAASAYTFQSGETAYFMESVKGSVRFKVLAGNVLKLLQVFGVTSLRQEGLPPPTEILPYDPLTASKPENPEPNLVYDKVILEVTLNSSLPSKVSLTSIGRTPVWYNITTNAGRKEQVDIPIGVVAGVQKIVIFFGVGEGHLISSFTPGISAIQNANVVARIALLWESHTMDITGLSPVNFLQISAVNVTGSLTLSRPSQTLDVASNSI
jgi:hypothetical protein